MSDLISRQDAVNAVLGITMYQGRVPVDTVMYRISKIPSAEPKTGRWVRKEKEINDCDGHRAYYWYECDNCGARPPKDQWGNEWHSDFCPKCGSKMEVNDE